MTGLTLSVVLQAAVLGASPTGSYEQAFVASRTSGQPLLVLIGADWCPGCQSMKRSVFPALRRRGVLRPVAFATVNTDQQRELAAKLMSGGRIPQLVMFHFDGDRWHRNQLTGPQGVESVERFIHRGVAASRVARGGADVPR